MERTAEYRVTKGFDKIVNSIIAILLIIGGIYACFALWDTWSILNKPNDVQRQLMKYKPSDSGDPEAQSASFQELLGINPDICAWITIDDTGIDYPVVQGETNFDYLSTDVYGDYTAAGSIFLDCGNNRDFTDYYSILMGHHMQGGVMFGDLDKFMDEAFFENHTTGKLYLPDRTLTLETTAIIMADAYNRTIYDVSERTEDEKLALISEIEEYALHTRGAPMHVEDQFIALSTCSSDYTNARLLLICRVTGEN